MTNLNMKYLQTLNPKQKEAVLYQGNLMCVAGAGSGKTRTLTSRVAYLLDTQANPKNILGLTFTNKAANEMKERIVKMHHQGSDVNITTFHSFAAKFLRHHTHWIGRTQSYTIYDDTDQKSLLKKIIKDDVFPTLVGSNDHNAKSLMDKISKIKSSLTDIDINLDLIEHNLLPAEVYALEVYESELLAANAMDFNDLIRYTVGVMSIDHSSIPFFEHVLIDEFQDTDPVQFKMIQIFSQQSLLTAFADPDQTVYEWRSAIPGHVLKFIKVFSAKTIKLEHNYRSTPQIVQASNQMIKFNKNRVKKTMIPTRSKNFPIIVNRLADSDHEASSTSDAIKHLLEKFPESSIAILYRQNRYSRKMETSLRRMHIPYYLHKGVNFIKRKEIATTLRLFRFLSNPHDLEAVKSTLTHFCKGFGNVALKKVEDAFKKSSCDDILHGRTEINIRPALIESYRNLMEVLAPITQLELKAIPQYMHDQNIYDLLCTFNADEANQFQDRQSNLNELMLWIHEFAQENPKATLSTFVQESALDISEINDQEDANVNLMTVHSAKGLEFDFVFVIGCVSGFFPGKCQNEAELEEGRRLFYVAMTRAKDGLYFCVPEYTYLGDEGSTPTPYIKQIDQSLMKQINFKTPTSFPTKALDFVVNL